MHRHRIALDDGLSYYRDYLKTEGYDVVNLSESDGDEAEAMLLSGQDENFMGMADPLTKAFVIDVNGRRPDDVLADLRRHFDLTK